MPACKSYRLVGTQPPKIYSARFQRGDANKPMPDLQPYSCDQLRDYLEQKEDENSPILILDCRSFLAYNECHISSAINAYCPSILRRRARGTAPFHILIPSVDIRDKIRKNHYRFILLYEENPTNSKGIEDNSSNLGGVSRCLQKDGAVRNVYYLEDGFQHFRQQYAHLCVDSHIRSHSIPHGSAVSRSSSSPPALITSLSSLLNGIPFPTQQFHNSNNPFYEQGDPVEILSHLYLGCEFHAANHSTLERLAITALLNVSRTSPILPGVKFAYKRIPVDDSGSVDISSWFMEAIQFIDEVKASGGKVLVHCHAGISRSATICLAYLMSTMHLRLEEAYEFVKTRRSIISPNFNFMGQLLKYETQLFASASSSRGGGVNNRAQCSISTGSPLSHFAAAVTAKAKESCLISAQKFIFDVVVDDSYSSVAVSSPLISPMCSNLTPILSPS